MCVCGLFLFDTVRPFSFVEDVPFLNPCFHFYTEIGYSARHYEKDERNGLVSYDSMDTEDILGEETIPDQCLPSVEDSALNSLLIKQLH